MAIRSYGLMVSNPMVYSAVPTALDTVWARTQAGKTIDLGSLAHSTTFPGLRNSTYPLNLWFDSNVKWTGDSGNGVIDLIAKTQASGSGVTFRPGNQTSATFYNCVKNGNLRVVYDGSVASAAPLILGSSQMMTMQGVEFYENPATQSAASTWSFVAVGGGNSQYERYLSCNFNFLFIRARLPAAGLISLNGGTALTLEIDDCDFNISLNGTPTNNNPVFGTPGTWGTYGNVIKFTRNRFPAFNSGTEILKPFTGTISTTAAPLSFIVHGNKNLQLGSAALGVQNAYNYNRAVFALYFSFLGEDTGRHQRIEWQNGIAEWNPAASPAQPYLAAVMPDGTGYSIAMTWLTSAVLTHMAPFTYRSTVFNRLATAIRVINTEFLIPPSTTVDRTNFGVVVSYIDNNGIPRAERTHGKTDPASSSAVWQTPALIAASYSTWIAQKLAVTTAYQVKQNTEVSVEVQLCGPLPVAGGNKVIYIDPEFTVA